jgi:malonate-semialdehyde dehydrogenase (acetylating)/methylmalonate-semialdehyde dehydrogenase
MSDRPLLKNYIDGSWCSADATGSLTVANPATAEILAEAPLSSAADVERAAAAARSALRDWRRVPAGDRIQHLFRLKELLEKSFEELARTVTLENGKTLAEARGEIRRAIENVEVACGIPTLLQGDLSEDIAPGIDELMIRQPLGVCTTICPFNFPAMIPFWFLPYALACGNTYLVKPSERTPLTMEKIFHLVERARFPKGAVNMVHGGADTVKAILDHPEIAGVTFVGSTPVARYVYERAAARGKRVQAQGGAKNPLVILPDADLEATTEIAVDSAFGNAGQRCLAASLAITVGEAREPFVAALAEAATRRVVGYGLEEGVEMGPVISPESQARIEGLVHRAAEEGTRVLVDGREASVPGFERGNFLRPTVLDRVPVDGEIARTEIFGPVLGLMHAETLEEAIELVNRGHYGNMACLFTRSGAAARRFRYEVEAGNIGINIGVAAPMAYFPFSGWKESFFGTLHGQGRHAVEFFTQTKVVVERWPKQWSRRF